MKDYSEEFSEEKILKMWMDFGKSIRDCKAVLLNVEQEIKNYFIHVKGENNKILSEMNKTEEEMKSYLGKVKGESSKSLLEISQLNAAAKNTLSKINSFLDKTEKVFDEDRLKHIAENFIRKAVELRIESLKQDFLVEADKQLKPKIEDLYRIIEGAKKYYRRDIKSEKKELTKLKKDFVKREKARKDKKAAESEENTKTVTKSVIKESNSI